MLTKAVFFSPHRKIVQISSRSYSKSYKRFKEPKQEDFIERVDYEKPIQANAITRFQTNIIGGNLVILPSPNEMASIRVQWDEDKKEYIPNFNVTGDCISLTSNSLRPFLKQKGAYIIEVTLPENIEIFVKMLGGTLFIDHFKTPLLDVDILAGTVSGAPLVKTLRAKLKAGAVHLHHLQGNAAISVGAGDIKLSFDDLAPQQLIDLQCRIGDVKLTLPPQALPPNTSIKKAGKIDNLLGANIYAKTFLGDVKIDCWEDELHLSTAKLNQKN